MVFVMKWLCERQRTIREAWEILFEAVSERLEFFGMDDVPLRKLPPRPVSRNHEMPEYLEEMRYAVYVLVRTSFDPAWFGQWTDLDTSHFLSAQSPEGEFFTAHGVDGYAFYRQNPSDRPSLRHTLSDFIQASAKMINDTVLYPMPQFSRPGFCLDGKLQVKDLLDGGEKSGDFSAGFIGVENENGALDIYPRDLAVWKEDLGSGKAYGHCWHYAGKGEKISFPGRGIPGYILPELQGSALLRSHIKSSYGENYEGKETLIDRDDEYVMDFSTGYAAEKIDLSAAEIRVNDVLNSDSETAGAWYRWVNFQHSGNEIKLHRENFKQLPYKYLEE